MSFIKENRKLLVKMTVTLFAITAAATLLLAGVQALTEPNIAENARIKTAAAMEQIVPGGEFTPEPVSISDDATLYGVTKGGAPAGYCVLVAPVGFKAEISMIVGVGTGGEVLGVAIISMTETAGLGTRAQDPEFLAQYEGLSGDIQLGAGDGKVDALTGATVTSKAVTLGVNTALTAVKHYELGGASS
ncbi:FMN-binding protein [Oscillospiraceae bacterium OttesenSCG-928-G22]|nr:FMN-binding protein [Oscillospiraceae bacterium OttesenSCG-928-G22]